MRSDEQLRWVSPLQKLIIEQADATFSILADTNTKMLTNTDPAKQMQRAGAMNALTKTYMERAASGALRWSLTLYPTEAYAQDAEMSLAEYEDFVYGAGLLNEPDPVAAWKKQGAVQQRLIDWLHGKDRGACHRPRYRPDALDQGSRLHQCGRLAQLPGRRDFHRPGRE